MKIVADENIVAVQENYRQHGELVLLPGRSIRPPDVRDADVLLVRSITHVDRALLEGSRVRFVATATSGTDHLDLDYLVAAGIGVADAAGSNANAVVEYCLAGIAELICTKQFTLRDKTVAIIGFGHVGSRLYRRLRSMDVACVVCDPFVAEKSREDAGLREVSFCDLDSALSAQIITLHVPLTKSGDHATYHLFDKVRLAGIASGTLLINAARGEVVDNQALLQRLSISNDILTLFDVWENEPKISRDLLKLVSLGTPHIAGYSIEAKSSASEKNYQAFLQYFGLADTNAVINEPQPRVELSVNADWSVLALAPNCEELFLAACLRAAFPVIDVDRRLRALGEKGEAELFDVIRKSLATRREFSHFGFDKQLFPIGRASETAQTNLLANNFLLL
ncbi:MAG: 4-phosphoerythronate dehydrogenase [Gammaproteobacteria bacterium]|nr:4-phosphoerythronate dehydrogenase [Gammaproteobacteria bacterium]